MDDFTQREMALFDLYVVTVIENNELKSKIKEANDKITDLKLQKNDLLCQINSLFNQFFDALERINRASLTNDRTDILLG